MNPFNRNAALWIVIVLLLALLYSVFQGGTTRTAGNTVSYWTSCTPWSSARSRTCGSSNYHHRHFPRTAQRRAEVRHLRAERASRRAADADADQERRPRRRRAGGGGRQPRQHFRELAARPCSCRCLHLLPAPDAERHRPGHGLWQVAPACSPKKHGRVTFEDVAGIDEAKAELEETSTS